MQRSTSRESLEEMNAQEWVGPDISDSVEEFRSTQGWDYAGFADLSPSDFA